jgi:hypothetical protein
MHRLAHGLCRVVADPWREGDEEFPVAVFGPSRPKRIPQKVKPRLWVRAPAVIILTVNDLRLIRMQPQATRFATLIERHKEVLGLSFRATVHHSV